MPSCTSGAVSRQYGAVHMLKDSHACTMGDASGERRHGSLPRYLISFAGHTSNWGLGLRRTNPWPLPACARGHACITGTGILQLHVPACALVSRGRGEETVMLCMGRRRVVWHHHGCSLKSHPVIIAGRREDKRTRKVARGSSASVRGTYDRKPDPRYSTSHGQASFSSGWQSRAIVWLET